ncbi:MAG TPA: hypothetical protein VFW77_02075 [Candidatus Saccharimonadales bacterium]|nr:hypothetical protein [Candidatus Saccharimonadales bacterium]
MSPEFLKKKLERVPKNPIELGKWLARWVQRHDQIGQISYVAQRLRWDIGNYDKNRPPNKGEFSIEVSERTGDCSGMRRVISYFKEIEGNPYTRQVIILSNDGKKPMDTDKLFVSDIPQSAAGDERPFSYRIVDEGLAGESELPFAEIEEELTGIYKQVKEEYWGQAGPPGG